MKLIIAPTDFSRVSVNAANYAADMACLLGMNLALLHVYAIPVSVSEIPVTEFSIQQLESKAQDQMTKLKNDLSKRTGGRISINTRVTAGDVIIELGKYCADLQPFAVIMGAETANTFERILWGGTAIEALKRIKWPLIIVPPLVSFNNIRKIGLACDFRDVVKSVRIGEIKELVKEFNAELHIIHITDEDGSYDAASVEESALLQEMVGELNPKYHFMENSQIENGIVKFAEDHKINLLIVIPKKHPLPFGLLHASHSKELLLRVGIPLMSFHA